MKQQPVNLHEVPAKRTSSLADREAARAKLREAGVLANDLMLPVDLAPVTEEELQQLGAMQAGARPSEEIIAQDRGR